MNEALEKALEQIATISKTVQENGGLAGLDREALMADFQAALEAHRKSLLDELPARPGEFQGDEVVRAAEAYEGKYKRELKDISRNGEFKIGTWKLRGTDLILTKLLMEKATQMKQRGIAFDGVDKIKPPSEDLVNAVKTLTSTGTGTGDELVPTGMATELWQDFFVASRIAGDLPNQPMPTDPFDISLGFGQVTFRKGGQGAPSAAQDPATAKSVLTSTELLAEVNWSYNLDEDAIVAMMPALRQQLTIDGGEYMDRFVVNADSTNAATGNINLDDANPDDDSYYLSDGQDGIRHLPIVDNTGQANSGGGDALADGDMTALLNDLGKYGLSINEVRIVPGIQSYFAMLGLTNVATVDKYGEFATIVRGELARYRGYPVIPSVAVPLTEADYKVSTTAGNNTLGQILAYNRMMWKVGFRRGLLIEVDRDIQSRKLIMVVSFRIAVAAHGTRSAAEHTSLLGNFTV